jgi:hypothetical protein
MDTNPEAADENKQPRVRLLSILLENRKLGWVYCHRYHPQYCRRWFQLLR